MLELLLTLLGVEIHLVELPAAYKEISLEAKYLDACYAGPQQPVSDPFGASVNFPALAWCRGGVEIYCDPLHHKPNSRNP